METKLRKILTEIYRGQKENNDEAVEQILLLFNGVGRSGQLCGLFEADSKTSSATKCRCGREKWEHPKAK